MRCTYGGVKRLFGESSWVESLCSANRRTPQENSKRLQSPQCGKPCWASNKKTLLTEVSSCVTVSLGVLLKSKVCKCLWLCVGDQTMIDLATTISTMQTNDMQSVNQNVVLVVIYLAARQFFFLSLILSTKVAVIGPITLGHFEVCWQSWCYWFWHFHSDVVVVSKNGILQTPKELLRELQCMRFSQTCYHMTVCLSCDSRQWLIDCEQPCKTCVLNSWDALGGSCKWQVQFHWDCKTCSKIVRWIEIDLIHAVHQLVINLKRNDQLKWPALCICCLLCIQLSDSHNAKKQTLFDCADLLQRWANGSGSDAVPVSGRRDPMMCWQFTTSCLPLHSEMSHAKFALQSLAWIWLNDNNKCLANESCQKQLFWGASACHTLAMTFESGWC